MSGTVGKPRLGHMTAIRIVALAVGCVFAGAPAFAAKYFDPEKRRWIEYDAERVRGAARAPSADPQFQRQVVEFRTAEQPGTIIIDPTPSSSITSPGASRRSATASASGATVSAGRGSSA